MKSNYSVHDTREFSRQYNSLVKNIGPLLVNKTIKDSPLVVNNAIIAGGAIRSVFTGERISDYDIFFKCSDDRYNFINQVSIKEGNSFVLTYCSPNANTYKLTTKNGSFKVQLIKIIEGSVTDILDSFDFTVTKAAYDFANSKWVMHDKFMQHVASKSLYIDRKLEYPLATILRVVKYVKKGYNVPPTELMQLAIQCQGVKINSIQDWKKHLMGIDLVYLSHFFMNLEEDIKNGVISEDVAINDMMELLDTYNDSIHEEDDDY